MDFLPSSNAKVSLGGKKKAAKSKDALLSEARARREQRMASALPSRLAISLQRRVRGTLARRRLWSHVLVPALSRALENGCASPALARLVTLVWMCCGPQKRSNQVASLVDKVARKILHDCEKVCACSEVDADSWLRRNSRLLPALLHTAAFGAYPAPAHLSAGLCSVRAIGSTSTSACSHPRCSQLGDILLTRAARPLIESLACTLQIMPTSVTSPCAAAITDNTSAASSTLATLGRCLLTAAAASHSVATFTLFTQLLPPGSFLTRPPLKACRLGVRTLFADLSGLSRRLLEESLAAELGRRRGWCGTAASLVAPPAVGISPGGPTDALRLDGQVHEAAAMLIDALISCACGGGTDWRRGGWTEGQPRLLTEEQLDALIDAQIERTSQASINAANATRLAEMARLQALKGSADSSANDGCADGSSSGNATKGCARPSHGQALMLLMRAQWDNSKAVNSYLMTAGASHQGVARACSSDSAHMTPGTPMELEKEGRTHLLGATHEHSQISSSGTESSEMNLADSAMADVSPPQAVSVADSAVDSTICLICFDEPSPPNQLRPSTCGHAFCDECWNGTLTVALERGPACIHACCPQPECSVPIAGDVWERALDVQGRTQLGKVARRTFVSCNALLAHCPNGSCGRAAAHVHAGTPPEMLPCECGTSFCILCGDPPHWPVSCTRKKQWTELLHQSPDAALIMQLTRPCPSCGVRTQRSAGCMRALPAYKIYLLRLALDACTHEPNLAAALRKADDNVPTLHMEAPDEFTLPLTPCSQIYRARNAQWSGAGHAGKLGKRAATCTTLLCAHASPIRHGSLKLRRRRCAGGLMHLIASAYRMQHVALWRSL